VAGRAIHATIGDEEIEASEEAIDGVSGEPADAPADGESLARVS